MHDGEMLNTATHAAGTALAVAGSIALAAAAWMGGDPWKIASFSIYGATLVLLYAASALYHGAKAPGLKRILQRLDHCAIYLLIAGSYTPIAMVTLRGPWGVGLLATVWALAVVGIAQEMAIGGKSEDRWLSLAIYVVMGCLAFGAFKPLLAALPVGGVAWLLAAGAAYLSGIYFYLNDHRPHYHGVWHVFVMAGSVSHFMCLYCYVV